MKGCCLLIVFWVVTDAIPVFKKAEWDENKKVTKWEDTKAQNLTFSLAGDSSIEIDLCKLIHCENIGQAKNYAKANVYVCWMPEKPPKKQSITSCLGWDHAMWTTASRDWGYNVPGARASKIKTRFSVKRLRSECTTFDNCNKLLFTLKEPMKTDERLYTIGVWVSGKDPQGTFFLSFPENKIQTGKEFQTQEKAAGASMTACCSTKHIKNKYRRTSHTTSRTTSPLNPLWTYYGTLVRRLYVEESSV